MSITAKTKLCLIIGDPIEHSLSPLMHNAAYERLHISDQFVHVAARVPLSDLEKAVQAVRTLHIRGLTCTMPHKIAVMQYLDQIDETARKIGAVNSVINTDNVLTGYNTDWIGGYKALEQKTELKQKRIAILGAGGAARAIIYGMIAKGGIVTVYNRTKDKAVALTNEFGGNAKSFTDLEELVDADIIINATSVGMSPSEHESPIPKEYIKSHHIVFDLIYSPFETRLLKDAADQGATLIHGIDMLLYEGAAKFTLYTGFDAPIETMRNVLHHYSFQ